MHTKEDTGQQKQERREKHKKDNKNVHFAENKGAEQVSFFHAVKLRNFNRRRLTARARSAKNSRTGGVGSDIQAMILAERSPLAVKLARNLLYI